MIIADTSAILATIDTDTIEHASCVEVLELSQRPVRVPHGCRGDGLPAHNQVRHFDRQSISGRLARGAWELVESNAEDINDVITVSTRYAALKLGATDCVNVVLAAHRATNVLFTLDHRHFRAVTPLDGSAGLYAAAGRPR